MKRVDYVRYTPSILLLVFLSTAILNAQTDIQQEAIQKTKEQVRQERLAQKRQRFAAQHQKRDMQSHDQLRQDRMQQRAEKMEEARQKRATQQEMFAQKRRVAQEQLAQKRELLAQKKVRVLQAKHETLDRKKVALEKYDERQNERRITSAQKRRVQPGRPTARYGQSRTIKKAAPCPCAAGQELPDPRNRRLRQQENVVVQSLETDLTKKRQRKSLKERTKQYEEQRNAKRKERSKHIEGTPQRKEHHKEMLQQKRAKMHQERQEKMRLRQEKRKQGTVHVQAIDQETKKQREYRRRLAERKHEWRTQKQKARAAKPPRPDVLVQSLGAQSGIPAQEIKRPSKTKTRKSLSDKPRYTSKGKKRSGVNPVTEPKLDAPSKPQVKKKKMLEQKHEMRAKRLEKMRVQALQAEVEQQKTTEQQARQNEMVKLEQQQKTEQLMQEREQMRQEKMREAKELNERQLQAAQARKQAALERKEQVHKRAMALEQQEQEKIMQRKMARDKQMNEKKRALEEYMTRRHHEQQARMRAVEQVRHEKERHVQERMHRESSKREATRRQALERSHHLKELARSRVLEKENFRRFQEGERKRMQKENLEKRAHQKRVIEEKQEFERQQHQKMREQQQVPQTMQKQEIESSHEISVPKTTNNTHEKVQVQAVRTDEHGRKIYYESLPGTQQGTMPKTVIPLKDNEQKISSARKKSVEIGRNLSRRDRQLREQRMYHIDQQKRAEAHEKMMEMRSKPVAQPQPVNKIRPPEYVVVKQKPEMVTVQAYETKLRPGPVEKTVKAHSSMPVRPIVRERIVLPRVEHKPLQQKVRPEELHEQWSGSFIAHSPARGEKDPRLNGKKTNQEMLPKTELSPTPIEQVKEPRMEPVRVQQVYQAPVVVAEPMPQPTKQNYMAADEMGIESEATSTIKRVLDYAEKSQEKTIELMKEVLRVYSK